MAQPLRSLPPQIKNAPLVVPTRRVKFVRVEVIKASLLIRTTTVHYIIGAAWRQRAFALGHKRTLHSGQTATRGRRELGGIARSQQLRCGDDRVKVGPYMWQDWRRWA